MARILVIDDDASLLQMMSLMLKRAGHAAILANDGLEGLDLARKMQPDMAIVDVMMPDMSGYEVCRILREDAQTMEIPLLILTALSQPEQREWAEDAGADDFVTKPVTRDDLVKHVDALLASGPRNRPAPLEPPRPARAPAAAPAQPGYSQTIPSFDQTPVPTGPLAPQQIPVGYQRQQVPVLPPLVAVMGLSSGVGATTLAANLALGLMQFGRSCLIDLSTQGGKVAAQLRMVPPRATWVDLLHVTPGSDKRAIGGALMLNHQSGVAVLAAPLQAVQERLAGDTLAYVLAVLAEGFPRIVADLPPVLSAMNIVTLRQASHIVLVTGDNPADLMLATDALATVEQLGLSGEQHLVFNQTRPHGVTYDQVLQTLNRPIVASIPYQPEQVDALTQGVPLVMSQPGSLFARTVLQLARQL
jgi:CheY-like chemotaxis protein